MHYYKCENIWGNYYFLYDKQQKKRLLLSDNVILGNPILYDNGNIIYWDRDNNGIKKYNFVKNAEDIFLELNKNKDVGYFGMCDNGMVIMILSPNMHQTIADATKRRELVPRSMRMGQ